MTAFELIELVCNGGEIPAGIAERDIVSADGNTRSLKLYTGEWVKIYRLGDVSFAVNRGEYKKLHRDFWGLVPTATGRNAAWSFTIKNWMEHYGNDDLITLLHQACVCWGIIQDYPVYESADGRAPDGYHQLVNIIEHRNTMGLIDKETRLRLIISGLSRYHRDPGVFTLFKNEAGEIRVGFNKYKALYLMRHPMVAELEAMFSDNGASENAS